MCRGGVGHRRIGQPASLLRLALIRDRISSAIDSEEGGRGQDALRLKLTEQYIQALNQILSNSKVLMLPQDSSSSGDFSFQKIAASISMLKTIVGTEGFLQASS